MPLNPELYSLLIQRFGYVHTINEGEHMISVHEPGLDNEMRLIIIDAGENYTVNCPYCGDTRQRLSFNHRYGVRDPITDSKNIFLAHCYNEDCLNTDTARYGSLYDDIFQFYNKSDRPEITLISEPLVDTVDLTALTPAEMPGHWYDLKDMDDTWEPFKYLTSRGFHVPTIASEWEIAYCEEVKQAYYKSRYRIIIPVRFNGELVGWQARYVGDLDWKKSGINKYENYPKMKRRRLLYNLDRAKNFPYCVVVEGPTSAWRVGDHAVATFGKNVSYQQKQLLIENWRNGVVFIMFDGDEPGRAGAADICAAISGYVYKVVPITLAEGLDPGKLDHDEIAQFLDDAATNAGLDINNIQRIDHDQRCISEGIPVRAKNVTAERSGQQVSVLRRVSVRTSDRAKDATTGA